MELVLDLLGGMGVIMQISILAWLFAVICGLPLALGCRSSIAPVRWFFDFLTVVLRANSELVLIFMVFYGLATVTGIKLDPIPSVALAIGLVYSGYAADFYRAGFLTVPDTQRQAALSIGLGKWDTLWRVVFPQAFRFTVTPVANMLIGIMKWATLASAVGIAEIVFRGTDWMEQTGEIAPVAFAMAGIYLVATVPLAWALRRLEDRLHKGYTK